MIEINEVERENLTLYQDENVEYDVQFAAERVRLLHELSIDDLRQISSTRNSIVVIVICSLNEKIQKHKQCAVE
jgi:hypothetical protein